LPEPVRRYFATVLADGQPSAVVVRSKQSGMFAIGADGSRWRPFHAIQMFTTEPVGFLWDARISTLPGVTINVRDSYVKGEAAMVASVLGVVPVIDVKASAELNLGALHRYLAEAPWFPTALLPSERLQWTAIDDQNARATLTDGANSVHLDFEFDGAGHISSASTPARFREVGGQFEPTPWRVSYYSYEQRNGVQVPLCSEAAWIINGHLRPYARLRLGEIAYVDS
jgi:hypothetical protein